MHNDSKVPKFSTVGNMKKKYVFKVIPYPEGQHDMSNNYLKLKSGSRVTFKIFGFFFFLGVIFFLNQLLFLYLIFNK